MSIEAIAYVKTLDVDNPMSRLLLFIIGENTFNDTGLCKVGQEVLADECRASERTLRDHLQRLDGRGVIKRTARPKREGGRLCDAIELVGFLKWLERARKPEPENSAGSTPKTQPAKSAGSPVPEPEDRLPVRYKTPVLDSRTKKEGLSGKRGSTAQTIGQLMKEWRNVNTSAHDTEGGPEAFKAYVQSCKDRGLIP